MKSILSYSWFVDSYNLILRQQKSKIFLKFYTMQISGLNIIIMNIFESIEIGRKKSVQAGARN